MRQWVLVAPRSRLGPTGTMDTALSLVIGRGAGLAIGLNDSELPSDDILDDQAEVIIDDRTFPAVAFTIANVKTLRLRSGGAGVDTGPIALDLPADALAYLEQCGQRFNIGIDRPSDLEALPVPRPRAAAVVPGAPVGTDGLNDKQKISGWDASELRDSSGKVIACVIRQAYTAGSGPEPRIIRTFVTATRSKGLTLMLKDTSLNLAPGPLAGTLVIDNKPFTGFAAQILSKDEVALLPQHGTALAAALGDGSQLAFKSAAESMEFPVVPGVVPWLRACTHRWGFGFEPEEDAKQ